MARALRLALVPVLLAGLAAGYYATTRDAAPAPEASLSPGGDLSATIRSEPRGFIRYNDSSAAIEQVSLLLDSRLIHLNRATDTVEPALAESWTTTEDGLTYTFALRRDVRFSDGTPFTSADVVFSSRVLYDASLRGQLGAATMVAGKPLVFEAPEPHTVIVRFPAPFAPGLRLLAHVPILPRHKLEAPFTEGRLAATWTTGTAPSEIVTLGPFVLAEHAAGQRLVFTRNPHYWRTDEDGVRLPYVDRLTLLVVPDQNAEALRLESGGADLMSSAEIRPEDYASFKRAGDAGRLSLQDVGIGLEPNLLWFNLSPTLRADAAWMRERAFRQAVSHAVDRQALVDTVYLGAGVPVYGPVTPGNTTWYSSSVPHQPHDTARARELLASIGFSDPDGDGMLQDAEGRPARFSIITQAGHTIRERSVALIQEHLRLAGIAVDVIALEQTGIFDHFSRGDYDAIYFGVQSSSTDPALNMEFWLSSGLYHFWNPRQAAPATEWEARIDDLMHRQASAPTLPERQQLFAEAQRILGDELPAIYFAAPRVTVAIGGRVRNARPVLQAPQVLWSAETLAVTK